MPTPTSPAGELADALMDELLEGVDLTAPELDLDDPVYALPSGPVIGGDVVRIGNADLTTQQIGGSGTFDVFMTALNAHLVKEYQAGRITGQEYSKTYIALVEGAMAQGVQFLLGKDQAYWAAINAQLQARRAEVDLVTSRVQLATAKTQLASLRFEMLTQQANFALAKMRLASESVNYDTARYQLDQMLPVQKAGAEIQNDTATFNLEQMLPIQKDSALLTKAGLEIQNDTGQFTLDEMLPQQKALLVKQSAGQDLQNATATYQLENMLPVQKDMLVAQKEGVEIQTETAQYQLSFLLPLQKQTAEKQLEGIGIQNETGQFQLDNTLPNQLDLIKEQVEVQRSQTLDTRRDGVTIVGQVGKQKALYDQQIISFKRRAEMDGAKPIFDAWLAQKGIDEGLTPPTVYTNASLEAVLGKILTNLDLD